MREPRAYAIEDAVFSGRFSRLRKMPEGMTVADQRKIVRLLWAELHGTPGVRPTIPEVVRQRGRLAIDSHASPSQHKIFMGALAGPAMVCHEVAHLIAPTKAETGAWHSKQWEDTYVTCVRLVIGEFHADRLAKAFEKARKIPSKTAAKRGVR